MALEVTVVSGIIGAARSPSRSGAEEEREGGKDTVVGWIYAQVIDVGVDWLLGMREVERSRETEDSSLELLRKKECGQIDPSEKIDWIRKQTGGTLVSLGGHWTRCLFKGLFLFDCNHCFGCLLSEHHRMYLCEKQMACM